MEKEYAQNDIKLKSILTKNKQENRLFLTRLKKAVSPRNKKPKVFQKTNSFINKNFNLICEKLKEAGYDFGDQGMPQQNESNKTLVSNKSTHLEENSSNQVNSNNNNHLSMKSQKQENSD